MNIRVADKIATGKFEDISIKKCIRELKKGAIFYEIIHPEYNLYVKPYFDIDDTTKSINVDWLYNNTIKKLNQVFGSSNDDWAISQDHRANKNSFHLILNGFKIKTADLIPLKTILNCKDLKIDPSVYAEGNQKFRCILSKKDIDKTSNGLKPITFKDDLTAHFITNPNDDDTIINIDKTEKEEKSDDEEVLHEYKLNNEQKIIFEKYDKLSVKKTSNSWICNITFDCPWNTHKSNNRYLVINKDLILLKCHSEKCKNKNKILWKENKIYNSKELLKIRSDKHQKEIEVLEKKLEDEDCNEKKINKKLSKLRKEQEKETYKKQKEYFEKFHCKVGYPLSYVKNINDQIVYYSENTLKQLYRNIKSGEWITSWLDDIDNKSYEKMDFLPPPLKCDNFIYNTFNGFDINKITEYKTKNFDIILDHIKILVNHDEKGFEYMLNYLSHIFQKPGELIRIALLFRSDQGVGKNLFWEELIGKMLGVNLWIQTAEIEKVIGRFSMINNKILVLLDEMNGKDSFMGSERIKNLITSPIIPFERKGIDAITINNCARYIFFSNNETPIKIEMTDRRFVVFDCDNSKRNNKSYFQSLYQAFNDINIVKSFYKFLMDRDISSWDINDRPITDAYKEIQSVNIPILAKFLDNFIDDYQEEEISPMDFYQKFKEWLKDNGHNMEYSNTNFGRRIKKYSGIEYKRKKDRRVYILNHNDLVDYLIDKKYREPDSLFVDED